MTIRTLIHLGQFAVARKHIENQRPWRGITVAHATQALKSGSLISSSGHQAIWQGPDGLGRDLQLSLLPISQTFSPQRSWDLAELVLVRSAFLPDGKVNDMKRRLVYTVKKHLVTGGK